MNIDFPPPSNGIYNNSGSCRNLVNYMEHEDMERMIKGVFVEGFFNLSNDDVSKAAVIKEIDSNIGQLMKTDAKFYAIHISPSEKELVQMGKTEKEQSDAMKQYIREVFIPAYAQNFNKDLTADDIKFFGKIHFKRDRSDNKLNMHCHLIVSRKDQSNKKKLSPLTNHRNTKNGAIKGGFDRKTLFQQVETGFDKLFGYQRDLQETFVYCNTMKNGTVAEKLEMQGKKISKTFEIDINTSVQQQVNTSVNHSTSIEVMSSLFSIFPSVSNLNTNPNLEDEYLLRKHRKKKKRRRLS